MQSECIAGLMVCLWVSFLYDISPRFCMICPLDRLHLLRHPMGQCKERAEAALMVTRLSVVARAPKSEMPTLRARQRRSK